MSKFKPGDKVRRTDLCPGTSDSRERVVVAPHPTVPNGTVYAYTDTNETSWHWTEHLELVPSPREEAIEKAKQALVTTWTTGPHFADSIVATLDAAGLLKY